MAAGCTGKRWWLVRARSTPPPPQEVPGQPERKQAFLGTMGPNSRHPPLRNAPPVPPAEELLDATLDWSGQTPIKALGKWLSPPSSGIGFYPHLEPWETREAKTRPGRQMPRRRVQSSHRVVGWESGGGGDQFPLRVAGSVQ